MMDIDPSPAAVVSRESSASAKLFEIAELRQLVFNHLVTERVDLLALAAVNKILRAHALRIWVCQLDLCVSAARKRLSFFRALPELLGHIRFLRIRSNVIETREVYGGAMGPAEISGACWTDLNTLLCMIADAATGPKGQPLVDLTMAPTDPIEIPIQLKQRIVAFRLLHEDRAYRVQRSLNPSNDDPHAEGEVAPGPASTLSPMAIAPGTEPTEVGANASTNNTDIERSARSAKKAAAARLHDIIQVASQGPGLLTLHLHHCPDLGWEGERLSDKIIELHQNSLRDLATCSAQHAMPYILLEGKYPSLEEFYHVVEWNDNLDALESFLDRHPGLITLEIDHFGEEVAVSHRQTFPRLRWIMTPDPFPPAEFAARHQTVIANPRKRYVGGQHGPGDEAPPNVGFKNLRYDNPASCAVLSITLDAGIRPSRLCLSCTRWDIDDERIFLEVLDARPDAAKNITCLEISSTLLVREWSGSLRTLLEGNLLPNLSELALIMDPEDFRSTRKDLEKDERELGHLIRDLVPLRSLKALHVEGPLHAFETDTLLTDPAVEFPPALRYLRWRTQHYRYISSDPRGQDILDGPGGGKRGLMKYIPARFRTRITPDGVWQRAYSAQRDATIYDHLS